MTSHNVRERSLVTLAHLDGGPRGHTLDFVYVVTRRAIELLGRMARFVRPGQMVLLKMRSRSISCGAADRLQRRSRRAVPVDSQPFSRTLIALLPPKVVSR